MVRFGRGGNNTIPSADPLQKPRPSTKLGTLSPPWERIQERGIVSESDLAIWIRIIEGYGRYYDRSILTEWEMLNSSVHGQPNMR